MKENNLTTISVLPISGNKNNLAFLGNRWNEMMTEKLMP